MKTYKNLYEKIISEENLKKAFYAAAKGKEKQTDVRQILNNIDEHVLHIAGNTEKREFRPAHHIPQEINDGFKQKKRRIIKPYYKYEQVVHHAIIQILAPKPEDLAKDPTLKKVLNRGAYEFSCGSIKGTRQRIMGRIH